LDTTLLEHQISIPEDGLAHEATVLDNERSFVLVYATLMDQTKTWHLVKLDKETQMWSQMEINDAVVRKTGKIDQLLELGSLMAVIESDRFYFINTHINPSSGWTLILTRDLALSDALGGWVVATYPDDTILYHPSQIHFAPTHFTEINVYDPDTRIDKHIFPQKPYQPLWLDHMEKVGRVYEQLAENGWCMQQNHHCNPEWFWNTLGEVAVNDQTDSLAFVITFTVASEPELQAAGLEDTQAIYVYRGVRSDTVAYREISLDDLKRRLGDDFRLEQLLEKEMLAEIFE
jgi:hypothetical protein